MADFGKVLFCVSFIFYIIDIGYGLRCLSCHSTNITSKCRQGSTSKSPKVETCYGKKAKCYETVTINEYGDANFQRGCSKVGVCNDEDYVDTVFCFTCQYNNCNYNYMDLDQEIEDYLMGVYDYDEDYVAPEETTPTKVYVNITTEEEGEVFEDKNETENDSEDKDGVKFGEDTDSVTIFETEIDVNSQEDVGDYEKDTDNSKMEENVNLEKDKDATDSEVGNEVENERQINEDGEDYDKDVDNAKIPKQELETDTSSVNT